MNTRFLALKLLRMLITIWFVVTFVFIVLRATTNPVEALLPPDATPDEIAQWSEIWGLDQPMIVQYGRYVASLTVGDLGFSYRDGRPVATVVGQRIPATLLLGGTALGLAIFVGIPFGIIAALRRNRLSDRLIMAFSVFGFAIPNFFFGILLILLFSLYLRWLPSSGSGSLAHLVMPAATLGLATAGALARFTRSSMLEALSKPFMETAAAKGASPFRKVMRHAVPNAAIPVVTILGLNIGVLISGSIVTETVFAWPGVGRLLISSVQARDLAVVQFLVLLIAMTMVVANLMVDILYGVLDPRIRVSGPAKGG